MSKLNERESIGRSIRRKISGVSRKVSRSQKYHDALQEPTCSSNSHRERSRNIRSVDYQEEFYDAVELFSSGENERNDLEHRDEGRRAAMNGADQEAGWWNFFTSWIRNLARKSLKVLGFFNRRISVTVMTQSNESTVDELMKRLRAAQDEQSLPLRDVKFLHLPEHGLDSFTFQTIDVMILCSSINYRRFTNTDVPNALYNGFLANASRNVGREKIAVIAHDFRPEAAEARRLRMANFKIQQPSTFEAASLVMMCGNLGTQLEMDVADWLQFEEFIINASKL